MNETKVLVIGDGGILKETVVNALCKSEGGVLVIDSLGTFKEAEQMLCIERLCSAEEFKYILDLKKDFSRSMFLTDARSKTPSHNGRKKKVNRLRVRKRVKTRHGRKK